MLAEEMEGQLRRLLVERDVDLQAPSSAHIWQAFRAFAERPVDGADPHQDQDRLLFEAGPSTATPPHYTVGLSRHVSFLEPDGYTGYMERLLCELVYRPSDPVMALQPVVIWGWPHHLNDWVRRVESWSHFDTFMVTLLPAQVNVRHDEL